MTTDLKIRNFVKRKDEETKDIIRFGCEQTGKRAVEVVTEALTLVKEKYVKEAEYWMLLIDYFIEERLKGKSNWKSSNSLNLPFFCLQQCNKGFSCIEINLSS